MSVPPGRLEWTAINEVLASLYRTRISEMRIVEIPPRHAGTMSLGIASKAWLDPDAKR